MDQQHIDKIQHAIDNVDERPFNELFGKKNRFAVKYVNPDFAEACDNLNLDHEKFDLNKGFYGKSTRYSKAISDAVGEKIKKLDPSLSERKLNYYRSLYEKDAKKLKGILQQRNIYSYLIFSRHPIDVLRMSDISGIHSCHSPDGSFFKCAQIEAQNSGGIVYIVSEKDFKKIKDDLNKPEIFKDKEREIKGLEVIARIRLRRFIDTNEGDDFAVPEQRYYVPNGNVMGYGGKFATMVLNYCRKHQSIYSENLTPEYIRQNMVHVGGHYSDEGQDGFTILLQDFFNKSIPANSIKTHEKLNILIPIPQEEYDEFIYSYPNVKSYISKNPKIWRDVLIRIYNKMLHVPASELNDDEILKFKDLETFFNKNIKEFNILALLKINFQKRNDRENKMFIRIASLFLHNMDEYLQNMDEYSNYFIQFTEFLSKNINLLEKYKNIIGLKHENIRTRFIRQLLNINDNIVRNRIEKALSLEIVQFIINEKFTINQLEYRHIPFINQHNAWRYMINDENIIDFIDFFRYNAYANLFDAINRAIKYIKSYKFLLFFDKFKDFILLTDKHITCNHLHNYLITKASYHTIIDIHYSKDSMDIDSVLKIIKDNKNFFNNCPEVNELYDRALVYSLQQNGMRFNNEKHLDAVLAVAHKYDLQKSLILLNRKKEEFQSMNENISFKKVFQILEKKETQNMPKPDDLKEIMNEVSLGKDKDGFFVYTHRCRSDSYPTPHKIPKSKIKYIGSTG